MLQIDKIVCLCILLLLSYTDILCHKVSVKILCVSNIMAIAHYFIFKEINTFLFLGGIGVGGMFLLVSKATREGMGYGDSWGILILGSYLGLWKLLSVLLAAFFFLAAAVIVILCKKKMSRRCTVPFFPFLTGGYVAVLLAEGGIL